MKFISDITVRPVQRMGGDHMVVAAAKVSTSGEDALELANEENKESNYGLIRYLMKQRHSSPFEHSSLTFFVHAPIFVYRDWIRHRSMSYNEESGRYKKLDPVFWIPRKERPMTPAPGYKSARPEFVQTPEHTYEDLVSRMKEVYTLCYQNYEQSINNGISNEVARAILPVGIYSSMWVSTNVRNLMHFLSLRTHDKTAAYVSYPQAEIEEAARVIEEVFKLGWPLTYKAFNECGRVC